MPATFITKEHFVSVLEALQEQYIHDRKNADVLGLMFNTEVDGAYDNSLLSNAILGLLREYFPKDADGHCVIEHWAYQLQFGKFGEEYEDAGALYERLLRGMMVSMINNTNASIVNLIPASNQGNNDIASMGNNQPKEDDLWLRGGGGLTRSYQAPEHAFTASECIDQLINAKKDAK